LRGEVVSNQARERKKLPAGGLSLGKRGLKGRQLEGRGSLNRGMHLQGEWKGLFRETLPPLMLQKRRKDDFTLTKKRKREKGVEYSIRKKTGKPSPYVRN